MPLLYFPFFSSLPGFLQFFPFPNKNRTLSLFLSDVYSTFLNKNFENYGMELRPVKVYSIVAKEIRFS